MGTLEVNIPPDILNDNDSSESGVAVEGAIVRLKCHATGFPAPTVEWKREDGRHIMLRREGEPPKPGKMQQSSSVIFDFAHVTLIKLAELYELS